MLGGLSPASGESMLTGSPASGSFISPTPFASSGSPKAGFLPAFLLGPGQQPRSSGSPRKYQSRPASGMNSSTVLPPSVQHHVTWSPDLIQRIPPTPSSASSAVNVSRFGGPPVRSLLTDVGSQKESFSIPLERLDSSNLNGSVGHFAASQLDPFCTQGDNFDPLLDTDDTWVTIFGFPPDSANFILKEFSTYGTIIQHEFASKGNWVHIKYQSPIQSRKALSKNGHLFAQGTIRVGVTPCIDKEVVRRYRRKNVIDSDPDVGSKRLKLSESTEQRRQVQPPVSSLLFSRFDTSTPVRSSLAPTTPRLDNSVACNSPISGVNRSTRVGSMRSLAGAYENGSSSVSEHQVANGTDGSILTKAWKYFFN